MRVDRPPALASAPSEGYADLMPLQGEYAPNIHDWAREQAEAFEASGGTQATELRGKPIIVVTVLGAKSGKLHKIALMRVEHEGQYALVASKGGAPQHPGWYHSVKKNPHVELQDGPVKKDYLAHEAAGPEREQWWARAVQAWPDYAEYAKKTERTIPLFVLTPIEQ